MRMGTWPAAEASYWMDTVPCVRTALWVGEGLAGTFPGELSGACVLYWSGGVLLDFRLLPALTLRKRLVLLDGGEAGALVCLLDGAEVQVLAWEFRPTMGASRKLGGHLWRTNNSDSTRPPSFPVRGPHGPYWGWLLHRPSWGLVDRKQPGLARPPAL